MGAATGRRGRAAVVPASDADPDTRPTHIAKVGRLPLLGAVARPAPVGGRANSAHRVRGLLDAVSVPPRVGRSAAEIDGPVLLIDDYVDTGWTMAIAARALRQAGATGVLPLALGWSS